MGFGGGEPGSTRA